MKMGRKIFWRDTTGASLVEFSILLPIIFVITFGIVEFGYVMYQQNNAVKATQMGARFAATRGPLVTGMTDCGVATNAVAGTDCSNVAGASGWSTTCTGAGGGSCSAAVMAQLLTEMQKVYPSLEADNLKITFSGTGLGYVGRGRAVPAITVSLEDLEYDYVAIGALLNLGSVLSLDNAQTTTIGEDIGDGAG